MKLRIITAIILMQLLASMLTAALTVAPMIANTSFIKGSEDYLVSSKDYIKKDEPPSDGYVVGNIWNFDEANEWDDFAYVDDDSIELVVGINDIRPDSYSELRNVVDKNGGKIVDKISIKGIEAIVVNLPLASVSSFMTEIQDTGLSRYLEPNLKFQTQLVPNDPYWNSQWGPVKIGADWAWNTTIGEASILVAVVDTGIFWSHPDLAANYVALGYDWVNNDADPMDDYGHGTHCAGIIAAVLNNSIGIAGLAQVRIMAEKGLDMSGFGYESWLANAIIHAVDQGADIISMSWGGYFHSKLIYDVIRYAYNAGVLLVAAAGNSATDIKIYPAAYDEVIAVAATDSADGPAWFTNFGDWVELSAPGVDIYSTFLNNEYVNKSGTSMAAPHVAGVAALVWSRFLNITRDHVRLHLRYTADDLGDLGFDEHYGYRRINARRAVEQTLPEHDLLILDWGRPPYVEPNSTGTVNVTIINFGTSNESNIIVQLWANDTQFSNVTIDYLPSGASASVSCQWGPVEEGKYNVTVCVLPISNEIIRENNVVWAYVFVGFAVKASVIHSAGTYLSGVISTWEALNARWYEFGDTIISIDYTALDKRNIAYEDIVATKADVLIISCAYAPEYGWEFTDSEIDAITRYVYEGHGLIVTAGTFYFSVVNNNKLTRLFGIDETISWNATFTSMLNILEPQHPLFLKIPDPYFMSKSKKTTVVPFNGKWDKSVLVGGKYVALGSSEESAIITYRGLVYISPWVEALAGREDLQLFYNAITWSRYNKPEHDLIVSLEAPPFLKPGQSTLLNATVSNIGLNNETNVELQLIINGNTFANVTIPELLSNSSYTLSYPWSSVQKTAYNITAYAPPVPYEDNPLNNRIKRLVVVACPLIQPIEEQWANYEDYVQDADGQVVGTSVWNFTYDHYISPYQMNITFRFESSLGSRRTYWSIVNVMNRWVEKGMWAGWWYPGWIETNITLSSEVRLLAGVATVVGSRMIKVGGRPIDCWELFLKWYDANYTFYYDKPSGLWIGYDLVSPYFRENLTLTSTNILIGTLIRPKPGNYAHYTIIHLVNNTVTATGTMNFTYIEYIDSRRVHIKVDYALLDTEWRLIENFTDWIIVNIQTRQIESGPEDWNGTYYFSWIETFIEFGSSVNVWNQIGTVVGTAEYTIGKRLFDIWLVYSEDENQICFYHYDQASGLLIESVTNNLGTPSQSIKFTLLQTSVDVTPPFIHIKSPLNNTITTSTIVCVRWVGGDRETEIAYYLVYVDTDLLANVTWSTYTITDLVEGKHIIRVEAYDLAENMNSNEVVIVIDLTGPTASIIAPSNGSQLRGDVVTINVSGSDAVSFDRMELYINDILTATFLSEGLYAYKWNTKTYNGVYGIILVVYDKAGHRASDQITVIVDNTVPIAEIRQPTESDYVGGVCDIVVYAYDVNLDVIHLYVDEKNAVNWTTSGAHTYTWNTTALADHTCTIKLVVYDKAGNSIETSVIVTVDNTPPVAEIMLPANNSYVAGATNVTFTFSDANLEKATLALDGKILVETTEATSYLLNATEITDGHHILTLKASDKAGNTKTSTVTVVIDNTEPMAGIMSPANGTVASGTIEITFVAWDTNLLNASLVLDETIIDVTGNASYALNTENLQDKAYTIKLIAFDLAGNQAEDSITVVVDNIDPTVSISAPVHGASLIGTVTINFTASDDHLIIVFLYIDNTMSKVTGQAFYEWDTAKVGDGTHILKIVAIDEAGNQGETHITVETMNVQKATDESYLSGRNLGVLVGAILGLAVGIIATFAIARKRPPSLEPSKVPKEKGT